MTSPGLAAHGIVESLDIYPTLLELCGFENRDELQLGGSSLVPMLRDPKAVVKRAAYGYWRGATTMRTAEYRICYFPARGKHESFTELFDLREDPFETRNAAGDRGEVVERLLPLLERNQP